MYRSNLETDDQNTLLLLVLVLDYQNTRVLSLVQVLKLKQMIKLIILGHAKVFYAYFSSYDHHNDDDKYDLFNLQSNTNKSHGYKRIEIGKRITP